MYFVLECWDSWPTGKVLSSPHQLQGGNYFSSSPICSRSQSSCSLVQLPVCVCGGEIIDKQRKMKDPHWHKGKHDCEEVTYQSLGYYLLMVRKINHYNIHQWWRRSVTMCVHTKSCSCVVTAWSNQLTEVLELPLEREDMAVEWYESVSRWRRTNSPLLSTSTETMPLMVWI